MKDQTSAAQQRYHCEGCDSSMASAKHASLCNTGTLRERAEKAEADRDEWKVLAQELRVQASRISGVLMDVEEGSFVAAAEALDEIGEIINGRRPTPALPGGKVER